MVVIENSRVLADICGPNDIHLKELESLFGNNVYTKGNELYLDASNEDAQLKFRNLLMMLSEFSKNEKVISNQIIRTFFNSFDFDKNHSNQVKKPFFSIPTGQRELFPRNPTQIAYVDAVNHSDIIFSIGPAGTGKTYIAIALALQELLRREKRKIVLTRPVVETGESLGFLPGDLTQKLSPYLKPLYDAMEDLVPGEVLNRLKENNLIEISPLAYMRGRSLRDCFVVLDEAQNTTREQMKMFLTRMGEGTKAIITGDITQVDLPQRKHSGLIHALSILCRIDEIPCIQFSSKDIIRSPLVKKIVEAYEAEKKNK